MLPYYFMIGVPLLFAMFHTISLDNPFHRLQKKNYTILFFFAIFFLLLALRNIEIGVDTSTYYSSFLRLRSLSWADAFTKSRWEVGFVALTKLIGTFTDEPRVYFAIIAAIYVIPIAVMYYRESEDDITAMALFLTFPIFGMGFSGMRQIVAMAFTPALYYTTRKKQLWRTLLLVLLASLFHNSALVLFIFYPLYHIKLRPKHLFWLIPGFVLTALYNTRLYSFIVPLFGTDYAERYSEITTTSSNTMIFLFIIFVAYAFWAPDENLMDKDMIGLRNIQVLVLFIQLFSPISPFTMRANYYYLLFVPLLIPKVSHRITRVDTRYVQLIRMGITAFFLIYYLLKMHSTDSFQIYPYLTYWQ